MQIIKIKRYSNKLHEVVVVCGKSCRPWRYSITVNTDYSSVTEQKISSAVKSQRDQNIA